MATNWTDLTLFTSGEVTSSLPAFFQGVVDAGGKTDYQVETKRDFERLIKDMYYGTGKLTSTSTDDFDIEQIDNTDDLATDILKASALEYNYLLIARFNMTNIEDASDQYGSYYTGNKEQWVMDQVTMDLKQLTFLEPEGVNELTPRSTPIVF